MPNLGARDPNIYGPIASIAELQKLVSEFADLLHLEVDQFTSNHEGEILEFIHSAGPSVAGFLINPAGLTTYGEATRHALQDTGRPYVEVHFANTARHFAGVAPSHQQQSRFTFTAVGLVMGLRQYSYLGALLALACALDDQTFLGAH
jgi:3-dehydroquinate dehydratase-2